MEKKVFVLGLPGSGKSTVARYLEVLARMNAWSSRRFNDYDILYGMFKIDKDKGGRFSRTLYDGFDVHDLRVFDEALKELEKRVLQRERVLDEQKELIIIEFARNDYNEALKLFNPEFLQDAFFLFVDADIEACKQRIKERVAYVHRTRDDHFVSEYIFEAYYEKDNKRYLEAVASSLKKCCGIHQDSVQVIENTSAVPMVGFLEEINVAASAIFGPSVCCPEPTSVLKEVAPNYIIHGKANHATSTPALAGWF